MYCYRGKIFISSQHLLAVEACSPSQQYIFCCCLKCFSNVSGPFDLLAMPDYAHVTTHMSPLSRDFKLFIFFVFCYALTIQGTRTFWVLLSSCSGDTFKAGMSVGNVQCASGNGWVNCCWGVLSKFANSGIPTMLEVLLYSSPPGKTYIMKNITLMKW